jgi:tape measure domain-containing protein
MDIFNITGSVDINTNEASNKLQQLVNIGKNTAYSLGSVAKTALGFAGGNALYKVFADTMNATKDAVVGFNAQLEQSSITFSTLLGSASEAQSMLAQLAEFAAKTPFEFPQLLSATVQLKAMGFEAKDVIPTLTAVGDAAAALGQSGDGVNRIVYALGQMKAMGKISALQMRELSMIGIPAWDMLAKGVGKTTAETQKMVKSGIIPADEALKILTEGMEKQFPGMMNKLQNTWQGVTSTLKDDFRLIVQDMSKGLFRSIEDNLIKIKDFVEKVRDIYDKSGFTGIFINLVPKDVQGDMKAFIDTISTGVKKIKTAFADVKPMLKNMLKDIVPTISSLSQQILPSITNFITVAITSIKKGINEVYPYVKQAIVGIGPVIKSINNTISSLIPPVVSLISKLIKIVSQFAIYIEQHWSTLGPIIGGVLTSFLAFKVLTPIITGVAGAFKGFSIAMKTAEVAPGIIGKISTAILELRTAPTLIEGVTGALKAFNLGLLATPTGQIILAASAILGVGAALYVHYQKQKQVIKEVADNYNDLTSAIKSLNVEEEKQAMKPVEQEQKQLDALRAEEAKIEAEMKDSVGKGANARFGVDPTLEAKLEKVKEQINSLTNAIRDSGDTIDATTGKITSLEVAQNNIAKQSTINSIIENTNAENKQNNAIEDLINQYQDLASIKNKSASQNSQMTGIVMQLTKSVDGLTVSTDKNGNMTITNTNALNIKKKALDDNRTASVNLAKQEITDAVNAMQVEVNGAKMTILAIRQKIKAYNQEIIAIQNASMAARAAEGDDVHQFQQSHLTGALKANIQPYLNQVATADKEINQLLNQLSVPKSGAINNINNVANAATKAADKTNKSTKSTSETAFDSVMKVYNYKKAMDQLTLQQEEAMLNQIRTKYAKTADQKMQIDEAIHEVRKEINAKSAQDEQDNYNKAMDLYNHKKTMGQLTLNQELVMLEEYKTKYAKTADQIQKIDEMIYSVKQDISKQDEENMKTTEDTVDKYFNIIKSAIKNKVETEEKSSTDLLKTQIDNAKIATETLIANYKSQAQAFIDLKNAQIAALDEASEKADEAASDEQDIAKQKELQIKLAEATNADDRWEIQQELTEAIAGHQETLRKREVNAQKTALQKEIDNKNDELQKETDAANKSLDTFTTEKQNEIDYLENTYYPNLLTDQALEDQTMKFMTDTNMQDTLDLLQKYGDGWNDLGKTFGQRLQEGMKPYIDELKSSVAGMQDAFNNLQSGGGTPVGGNGGTPTPAGSGTPVKSTPEKYTIQKGDTVNSIAKKFGVTPQAIINGNANIPKKGAHAGWVYQGSIITIPKKHTGGDVEKNSSWYLLKNLLSLNSDEIPTILQEGEFVVSRNMTNILKPALESIGNGSFDMSNQKFGNVFKVDVHDNVFKDGTDAGNRIVSALKRVGF